MVGIGRKSFRETKGAEKVVNNKGAAELSACMYVVELAVSGAGLPFHMYYAVYNRTAGGAAFMVVVTFEISVFTGCREEMDCWLVGSC